MPPSVTIVPANEASWEDLQAVLVKMQPGESWRSVGAEELIDRKEQHDHTG